MLRELSINLLLTIGSLWPPKIEDIHSGSLVLGQGLSVHCWVSLDKVL